VIANRVVAVARNAGGSTTALRSVPCQRNHASWTMSSASAALPSMRYAIPNKRGRTLSNTETPSSLGIIGTPEIVLRLKRFGKSSSRFRASPDTVLTRGLLTRKRLEFRRPRVASFRPLTRNIVEGVRPSLAWYCRYFLSSLNQYSNGTHEKVDKPTIDVAPSPCRAFAVVSRSESVI